jgi:medium-chain acyl-[acyl-carrier-protein] hydrolase
MTANGTGGKTGSWWLVAKPNCCAKVRLFCFPYAGGSASIYQTWHAELPDFVEVYGIQLPGRANRILESTFNTLPDLVADVGHALVPRLDRPFAFFGHSLGAILGFEVARWLRHTRGILPTHLFVSGRRAPHSPVDDEPAYRGDDSEFVDKLRSLNGTPREVLENAELLELLLPALRMDFELAARYRYTDAAPLSCPITVFGGSSDEESHDGRIEAWSQQTDRSFAVHTFEGGHFFIHSHQAQILSIVGTELATPRQ